MGLFWAMPSCLIQVGTVTWFFCPQHNCKLVFFFSPIKPLNFKILAAKCKNLNIIWDKQTHLLTKCDPENLEFSVSTKNICSVPIISQFCVFSFSLATWLFGIGGLISEISDNIPACFLLSGASPLPQPPEQWSSPCSSDSFGSISFFTGVT